MGFLRVAIRDQSPKDTYANSNYANFRISVATSLQPALRGSAFCVATVVLFLGEFARYVS